MISQAKHYYRDDMPGQPIIVLRPHVIDAPYALPVSGVTVTMPVLYQLPVCESYPEDGSVRPVYI